MVAWDLPLNTSQASYGVTTKPRYGLALGQVWRWEAVDFQLTEIFGAQLLSGW